MKYVSIVVVFLLASAGCGSQPRVTPTFNSGGRDLYLGVQLEWTL
jgi:hypothetical protein